MSKLKRIINSSYLKSLSAADYINIFFLFFLSVLNTISFKAVPYWYLPVLLNFFLTYFIIYVVNIYEKAAESYNNSSKFSFIKIFRYWYGVFFILVCFKETYILIHYISPPDLDAFLIQLDYKIFGLNPTQWAYQFHNRFLTEFFQIIYAFYYIMIIIYGLELYLWKRYREFMFALFVIFTGFYISYTLYLIFPAVGPRFHLHDFYSIKNELPGLFFTDYIRAILDFGESIPSNVPNPADFAQRDALPSVHTSMALTIAYLSWKIKSKSFFFYLPYCFLMMVSTIYLRYHYVVDIIAGILLALITMLIGEILLKKTKPGKYGKIRGIM